MTLVCITAGVIADVNCAKRRAWQRVAREEGLQLPGGDSEVVYNKIYDMRLERAVTEVCPHDCLLPHPCSTFMSSYGQQCNPCHPL